VKFWESSKALYFVPVENFGKSWECLLVRVYLGINFWEILGNFGKSWECLLIRVYLGINFGKSWEILGNLGSALVHIYIGINFWEILGVPFNSRFRF